jgi:hypothetical protein
MKITLIYNNFWKDVYNGDKSPIRPIDARELAKWELKDEKELKLLIHFVIDEMFVHIENEIDA